jgi:hypothetical protein
MNLKLITPILIFTAIILKPIAVDAQAVTRVDLEKLKSVLQQEREAIFIEAMQLTVSQATVFHPISVDFNNEKRVLDDLLIKLIIRYANNYTLLDKEIMNDFIKRSEKFQLKELSVRKKYYKRISNEISVEVASQFYEVDDFISTNLRLSVLTGLPFTNSIIEHISK